MRFGSPAPASPDSASRQKSARRGGRVSLVDLRPCPGPHSCSWWPGGMLAPDCEGESAEEPVVRLGREAADWWQERTGIVKRNGTLVVALSRDAGELRRFARRTQGHEDVDADGIEALEPDLAGRCRNALYFSGEAHVAPRAALGALVKRLADQGISVETAGADERGATADRGSAGRTEIDCRGLAAADALPGPGAVAPDPASSSTVPAVRGAAWQRYLHAGRDHDRIDRAQEDYCALPSRTALGGLRASSGFRRSGGPGNRCRRAPGLPRQFAAHSVPARCNPCQRPLPARLPARAGGWTHGCGAPVRRANTGGDA